MKASVWVEARPPADIRDLYSRTRSRDLEVYFFPIAFGNQTISFGLITSKRGTHETHGFAPPLRNGFAFIGAITEMRKNNSCLSAVSH